MHVGDTIVAVGSPPGVSTRALVRVSGPGVRGAMRAVLAPAPIGAGAFVSRMRLHPGVLPVLAAVYAGPRSYTGEDAAELLVPGNPRLVERVVDRFLACPGIRQAEPGEFTARAYLNSRLTLDEAEGVAATIAAATADQLAAAARLMDGSTGARYRAWTEEVATLAALVEAGIDFTDQEDVRPIDPGELRRRVAALRRSLGEFLGSARGSSAASGRPTVVLAGAPNAGKSTLFNALLGRRRAVASPVAGTTRDVLWETLELAGDAPGADAVALADAAGIDAPARAGLAPGGVVEAAARERALAAIAEADVVVLCDPEGRFDAPWLGDVPRVIRARTKADLPPARTAIDAPGVVPVCALDGWNLGALRRSIAEAAWGARCAGVAALAPRHRRALVAAVAALDEASATVEHAPLDDAAIAQSLRAALDALGALTGRIGPDEVLGLVFASFCIGK